MADKLAAKMTEGISVGFLGIGRGIGNRRRRIFWAATERECDSADRAYYRANEQGEENSGPAEKSADHPEQPHVGATRLQYCLSVTAHPHRSVDHPAPAPRSQDERDLVHEDGNVNR